MPYKNPERKRQWEREHRDERNARRRKSVPGYPPNSSQIDRGMPTPIADQNFNVSTITTLIMGFALVFILLFAKQRAEKSLSADGI